ncbi:MAG: DUF2079 domain-containing protein [Clostridiales bacterium]|nr:DUF2079 domain-containing protein [Clostridiales bacterium]
MDKLRKKAAEFVDIFKQSGYVVAAVVTAFIIASIFGLFDFNKIFADAESIKFINLPVFIAVFAASLVYLAVLCFATGKKSVIPIFLVASALVFSIMLVTIYTKQLFFDLGVIFIDCLIIRWALDGDKLGIGRLKFSKRVSFWLTVFFFAVFSVTMASASAIRYKIYGAPSFDFGIFAQMFENMRHTGLPLTTVERNKVLSHFGVHFSPIFYLVLPFYMIYPHPETILVIQAVAVASGVFAVYKITDHIGYSPKCTLAFSLIYLLMPSMSVGCFCDFHENKFLSVMILWTVYFMLRGKTAGLFIFSLLTLSVKEDAAIYVFAIALYIILAQKDKLKGVLLFVMAFVYFLVAVKVVDILGNGVMTTRLENYWAPGSDEKGFAQVIKTCVGNMGYLIGQVFVEEKLKFVLWMLLPVMFTPFLNKKISTLVLLVPMLVINLMPNYVYQYNFEFQYTYGSGALIIAAAALTVAEFKPETKRTVLACCVTAATVLTMSVTPARAAGYYKSYGLDIKTCRQVDEMLEKIPKDADILSNTFIASHLYNYENVYIFPNYNGPNTMKCTYALVDTRYEPELFYEYMGDDYVLTDSTGFCEVYMRKEAAPNA